MTFVQKRASNQKKQIEEIHFFAWKKGVNAAVTFRDREVTAEAIGIYSRRVTEVFAQLSPNRR